MPHERVWYVMRDGAWRTLAEIAHQTGDLPASIPAQFQHLRKRQYGGWRILKRPRLHGKKRLEYRLLPSGTSEDYLLKALAEAAVVPIAPTVPTPPISDRIGFLGPTRAQLVEAGNQLHTQALLARHQRWAISPLLKAVAAWITEQPTEVPNGT